MKIIYLHGFNSTGSSKKVDNIKKRFPNYTTVSPTLSADPQKAFFEIKSAIDNDYQNTILIGTSLGAYYALMFSCMYDIPCFLVNPSLKPYETLKDSVGSHIRYNTENQIYDFKEEYLLYLKKLSSKIDVDCQNSNLINIYIAKDDDRIDFSDIHKLIPKMKTLKYVENAGHRFSKFDEVLDDVEVLAQELEKLFDYDSLVI